MWCKVQIGHYIFKNYQSLRVGRGHLCNALTQYYADIGLNEKSGPGFY